MTHARFRSPLAALALAAFPAGLHAQFGTQQRPVETPAPPPITALDDIRYLSDDRLGGRMTGSPGADSAAAYLARRFEQVGLQPAAGGWFQSFTVAKEAPVAQSARVGGLVGRNVIGLLPGHDPNLRNETVVVGAHYDHLGLGGFGSLDPDSAGRVHNGADDNASGSAMLIQIAERLAQTPPARTVLFIAFSGEELGLLGSAHYVKQPLYPLTTTMAMVNLDMVGRLRNGRLIVYGARTAKEFPALLDSLNWHAGFDLKAQGDGYGPSDQSSFYGAGKPVLHLFTDLVSNWVVYPERMHANLESTGGAIFSQRAMLALVEAGVDRQVAYKLIQKNAMRAWDTGGHLRDYLRAEPEVSALLSADQIDELFDYGYHLRHVDVAFERLGLLQPALAGTEARGDG